MSRQSNLAKTISRIYPVVRAERLRDLCGPGHGHLTFLEERLNIRAESQGGGIGLTGLPSDVAQAETILAGFERRLTQGAEPTLVELEGVMDSAMEPETSNLPFKRLKKPITARTKGQTGYLAQLTNDANGLIFGVGPAGTGKTFLAVACGVSELLQGKVERLIVTRPAVEAGEKLGFLPGTLEEKVDPYMLPIWDSLRELIGQEQMEKRIAKGEIEVAPLAFMRGRTLKNAFVIVDEAQNMTVMQMKMLLTRLGRNSRMVVTGDPGQVDLPSGQASGLAHALRILKGIKGSSQSFLTSSDVVRHPLVGRIIDAYAKEHKKSDG